MRILSTGHRSVLALLLFVSTASITSHSLIAQQPAVTSPSAEASHTSGVEAKPKTEEKSEPDFRKSPMVVKMGHMLGMEPETAATVFTWLNFLILAVAVVYGLFRALPKAFRGRTEGIQKNLVEARSATEEANSRLSNVEARLAKLDSEIAALRTEAEKDAAADEARIKATVEEEKKRILESADQEISAATAHAERSLREFAARLAVEQAAARLTISADDDQALIAQFAARLGTQGKGGAN